MLLCHHTKYQLPSSKGILQPKKQFSLFFLLLCNVFVIILEIIFQIPFSANFFTPADFTGVISGTSISEADSLNSL